MLTLAVTSRTLQRSL